MSPVCNGRSYNRPIEPGCKTGTGSKVCTKHIFKGHKTLSRNNRFIFNMGAEVKARVQFHTKVCESINHLNSLTIKVK